MMILVFFSVHLDLHQGFLNKTRQIFTLNIQIYKGFVLKTKQGVKLYKFTIK